MSSYVLVLHFYTVSVTLWRIRSTKNREYFLFVEKAAINFVFFKIWIENSKKRNSLETWTWYVVCSLCNEYCSFKHVTTVLAIEYTCTWIFNNLSCIFSFISKSVFLGDFFRIILSRSLKLYPLIPVQNTLKYEYQFYSK